MIGFLLRLFFYKKYPLDADSFLYLRNARDHFASNSYLYVLGNWGEKGIVLWLCAFSILAIILFYILCTSYTNSKNSLIASILFAVSPIIFLNTYFGIIDKNVISIVVFLTILLGSRIEKKLNKYLCWTAGMLLFYVVWEGWLIVFTFLVIYIMYENKDKKWIFLSIIPFMIVLFFKMRTLYNYVFHEPDGHFINELHPIWSVFPYIEYILIVFVYLIIILLIRHSKKEAMNTYSFEILSFFYFIVGMILVFRISILTMPVIFLWTAIIMGNSEDQRIYYFIAGIFFLIVIGSMNLYNMQPMNDDGLMKAIEYTNIQKTNCLIGLWDKGYIYQYYSNKSVFFSAVPDNYKLQIDYLGNGNKTDCSVIVSNRDYKALSYMTKYDNLNITSWKTESMNRKEFISEEYNDRIYYVIER